MKKLFTIIAAFAFVAVGISSCNNDKGTTDEPIPVESITVTPNSVSLEVGQSASLTADVSPENAEFDKILWSSDNSEIAAVSDEGTVTAIAAGTTTVRAAAGGKTAVCEVSVVEKTIAVESITIDLTDIEMTVGEDTTLVATVLPENATDKNVTWSSSDKTIATVDENGAVTALAAGQATITAAASGLEATCQVTVKENIIKVESISLDSAAISLTVGGKTTLVATVLPENATDKTVTWSSSDKTIATVDENGAVTALAAGQATITAAASGLEATCQVTVKEPVQYIEIPDANFKAYLVSQFDTDKDGGISVEEAAAVTAIDCPSKSIKSLQGIEYFTGLKSLDCSDNGITSIDMSENKALTTLNCSKNSITSIVVSECAALTTLDCSSNLIAGIYVGANTALKEFNCSGNSLSMLYLLDNAALSWLDCSSNNISALNLSGNKALTNLYCSGNKITSLDVSALSALEELDCSNNSSMSTLSANNLASLTKLDCSYCNLSSLMVNGNTALTYLDFTSNRVAGIWLGLNTALTNLYCSGNKMTYLNLADNPELLLVICGKQDSALTLKLPDALKSKWETWKNIPNNSGVTLE